MLFISNIIEISRAKVFFQALYKIFTKKIKALPNNIINYLQLQLFVTLVSLPILIWWGLPISIASPIGNFIFGPFLMVFLLLSSLIFFCEICYIPNAFLISLLEYFNNLWLYIISWGKRSWLIAIAKPPIIILLVILLLTFLVLHNKKLSKPYLSILSFSLIIILTIASGYYNICISSHIKNITCFNRQLTLIRTIQTSLLIDTGVISRRVSAPSWVNYTLVPELIKSDGLLSLDYIISLKPSNIAFQALAALLKKVQVKYLYLVSWSGELNNNGWKAWQELLETIKKYDTKLIFIEKESITLNLTEKDKISIVPQQKLIKKNKLTYQQVYIMGQVANNNIELQSNL